MYRPVFSLFAGALLLSSCTRDVNLSKDIDLLSPSPGLDEVMARQGQVQGAQNQQYQQQLAQQQMEQQQMQQQAQQTRQQQPPQPTIQPTPMTPSEPATVSGKQADKLVDLVTAKGTIRLKLYTSETPNTVKNFMQKATSGFYNSLTFHRVESWVVQGGDPKGNGTGGGSMPSEINQIPFKVGSLGVARGGDIKINNDSQFFICTDDCSWLTGQYTNFGEVVTGMDVAKQTAIGDKIQSITEVK